MRRVWAGCAALLVAGCSSSSNSDFSAYYRLVRESMHGTLGTAGISRADAAAIPYATMGVRLDDRPESLLVLASKTATDQLWTSKAKIVFMTREGRIVRTVGLDHDLVALTPQRGTLPPPANALASPVTLDLRADFADLGVYDAVITCRMTARRRETILILERALVTMRIDETCNSAALSWRFTNSYWVDVDSGFVWRTLQHLHPKGATVRTQIFRPAE